MKRALFSTALLAAAVMGMASCGGSGSSSSQPTTSKIKTRAFVTNAYSALIDIVDYSKDQQSFNTISVGTQITSEPQFMVLSKDRKLMLVFDSGTNTVVGVDTAAEKAVGSTILPNFTESIVISGDGKTAWVAVPNANVTGSNQTGAVLPIDLTTYALGTAVSVPLARHLVMNNGGNKLLVFSDAASQVANPISIVDITDPTKASVTLTVPAGAGIDRPIWGAFGSDDNKPFVLSCGRECGGGTPAISVVDLTSGSVVAGSTVPLLAGTQLLLDGNTLYVAGTVESMNQGALTVLSINGTTMTASPPVPIGDGFHTLMMKSSNSKIFIGANPCTNLSTAGCLSIYDTASKKAVIDSAKGYVTGMTPIPGRSIMYVAEGGELKIYDTTTSAESTGRFLDIVGNVSDVKAIDQ